MAQRLVTVDDIDGTPDATTVTFSVHKDSYEIDLSDANLDKLRAALEPFIKKARKQSKPKATAKRRSRASNESKAIREWAAENGHEVPTRGRVPQAVVDAYASRDSA